MKSNTIIVTIAVLLVVVLLLLLTPACTAETLGNWIFNDTPTEIQNGFRSELLSTLSEQYQISIPDDAKFIKGLNTNSFRDPSVVVLFECPVETDAQSSKDNGCSYVFRLLKLNDFIYTFGGVDEEIAADFYDDMGGKMDHKIDRKGEPFTFISYSFEDERVLIRFVGRHPNATFN